MNFPEFKNKKVLIMGLGLNGGGLGAAKWFNKQGAQVTVTDKKTKEQLLPSLNKLVDLDLQYVLGEHREVDVISSDIIVRNPDVPIDSPLLNLARDKNIPIVMEESLFYDLTPYKDHVIGITGTRGKSTTTTLIYEIIKNSGRKALLGGNLLGKETLSLLDEITKDTWVVLELSSWQLQGFKENRMSPHISVLTNIYPDHLNKYKSMNDYIADKKIIFQFQSSEDYLIINSENSDTNKLSSEILSKVIWFKKNDVPASWKIKLPGIHNRENIAAAIKTTQTIGIDLDRIKSTVEKFSGVESRLETIRTINNIQFVNDTTSTTPIAGIMALRAFQDKPIILIAGGSSKNLDMTDFAKEMTKSVKRVILLEGNATDDMEKKIKQFAPNIQIVGRFNNLSYAVENAFSNAKSGDVILFSPAFPSFGMFANEFDRGEKFNQIVHTLK